jgi:hypothetical protein
MESFKNDREKNTNISDTKIESSDFIVVLTGINDISKKALAEKELIINEFPITLGREVPEDSSVSAKGFFQVKDRRPYCISPEQFSLKVNRGQICITDENSKLGTIVDGETLGGSASGKKSILLAPGKHEIQLGGVNSPIVFSLEIKKQTIVKSYK